jgi:alkylhydroperoxidase family enzyme
MHQRADWYSARQRQPIAQEETPMPRLDYLSDSEMPADCRQAIAHAEQAGSPDPRVLRLIFRSKAGQAWYRYWRALNEECELPADLKELCRVKIAFEHNCGYCGTVRSARAKAVGLTEDKIQEVWDYENSTKLTTREKLALRYADYLKHDIAKADNDAFYDELKLHFTPSEIIELGLWCAENVGAGSFVRTLNIIAWDEACELNPMTKANFEKRLHEPA